MLNVLWNEEMEGGTSIKNINYLLYKKKNTLIISSVLEEIAYTWSCEEIIADII